MKTVNFEIAQRLKELGYDQPTQNRFDKDGNLNKTGTPRYGEPSNWNNDCFNDGYRNYCSSPSFDEVNDWLIKLFNIYVYIRPRNNDDFVGIVNYGNNVWFDTSNKDYYKLRDILFLETIKIIRKEFMNEVLFVNTYQLTEFEVIIFSYKHNLYLNCSSLGQVKNYVSFHYQKMETPQPESYMEIIINEVKEILFVGEPSIDLYKLLNKKGFTFDKQLHHDNGFKVTDNASARINLNDKTFMFGPLEHDKETESYLLPEDAEYLINCLNFIDVNP